jgi:acyl dehydratase
MMEIVTVEQMKTRVGTEVFLSEWEEINQDRINVFADCTGDHQWIHVDEEQAAQGPFGKTIAHGFLTLSLIPYFTTASSGIAPEGLKFAVNYGMNKVRFINPVRAGSRVRDRAVLTGLEERPGGSLLMTVTHTIEIEGQEKPACVAEMLFMLYL